MASFSIRVIRAIRVIRDSPFLGLGWGIWLSWSLNDGGRWALPAANSRGVRQGPSSDAVSPTFAGRIAPHDRFSDALDFWHCHEASCSQVANGLLSGIQIVQQAARERR